MTQLKRVLFVDDQEDIRTIAKISLKNIGGFEVEICDSGTQVLEKIKCFSPDLLLFDVIMPEMDGPRTLENIREIKQFRTTPVIFMTANVQPEDIKGYIALGAIGVISKPFDPMLLAEEVKTMWLKSNA